ncbi:MAG: hypothetical protein ACLQVX_05745 [Limisphaerales bacterium]
MNCDNGDGLKGTLQTAVVNPAKKILLVDRTFPPALAIEWNSTGNQILNWNWLTSTNQIRHGGLVNVVFADGHNETLKWSLAHQIDLSQQLQNEYINPLTH